MGNYKFTSAEGATKLLSGYIRFGSLHYYRLWEAFGCDVNVGDRLEGIGTIATNVSVGPSGPRPEEVRHLACVGVNVGTDVRSTEIQITHNTFINPYVFSFSSGLLSDLKSSFEQKSFYYDCCIEVKNVRLLMSAIMHTGSFLDAEQSPHVSVREKAKWFVGGLVRYGELQSMPDPFQKHATYEWQREERLVLAPAEGFEDRDFIDVCFEPPPGLLEVVVTTQPRRSMKLETFNNRLKDLECLLSESDECLRDYDRKAAYPRLDDLSARLRASYWALRKLGFYNHSFDLVMIDLLSPNGLWIAAPQLRNFYNEVAKHPEPVARVTFDRNQHLR